MKLTDHEQEAILDIMLMLLVWGNEPFSEAWKILREEPLDPDKRIMLMDLDKRDDACDTLICYTVHARNTIKRLHILNTVFKRSRSPEAFRLFQSVLRGCDAMIVIENAVRQGKLSEFYNFIYNTLKAYKDDYEVYENLKEYECRFRLDESWKQDINGLNDELDYLSLLGLDALEHEMMLTTYQVSQDELDEMTKDLYEKAL